MSKKTAALNIRCLCEAAILVALAQALSYVKLMQLPNGGSLTPAMFPMLLFAIRWGVKPGLLAGFVFGLLQLIFDGAYAWGWQSMLLDYLVAFTPLGLAGLFQGKSWGIFAGTVVGCACRFAVHYISGITIYKIIAPTELLGMGVSKRRVKGSQRGKKGQQPLDDERDRGLSVIRNGCRPEQKQQEPPGDFPVFWESICFAVPA